MISAQRSHDSSSQWTGLILRVSILLCIGLLIGQSALAAEAASPSPVSAEGRPSAPSVQESSTSQSKNPVTTHHTIHIHGETLSYTATAGTMRVETERDKPGADIFFVAYVKDGENEPARRPVTFAFNGGPGASSVWLHMGALGPRRVRLAHPGQPDAPPYEMVDNESTWLDRTDLVFIDPVGTGFSREVAAKEPQKQTGSYYGVKEDVRVMGEFIRLYTTRYQRWNSPKFLAGESYGATRAVLLGDELLDRFGMNLNGLILISPVLDFRTISHEPGNDLPFLAFLPTYAVTDAYYNKTKRKEPRSVPEMARTAEQWAAETYWPLLLKGDGLTSNDRTQLIENLSKLTGLSQDLIGRRNLRIESVDFAQEYLGREHRTLGLMDSRFSAAGDSVDPSSNDPALVSTVSAYVAAFNDYVRKDLGYETDAVYVYLSREVNRKWDWKDPGQGCLNVGSDLAGLLRKSSRLQVYVATGYYDLVAPYFGTSYTLNHLALDSGLRKNIRLVVYEGGHQMYTDEAVLEKLKTDVTRFIRDAFSKGASNQQARQ